MNFKLIGQSKGKSISGFISYTSVKDNLPFPALIICCQITCSDYLANQKQGKEKKEGELCHSELTGSVLYSWTKLQVLVTNACTKEFLEYLLIIRPSEMADVFRCQRCMLGLVWQ